MDSRKAIIEKILDSVETNPEIKLIDILVETAERNNVDMQDLAAYVKYKPELKERIRQEALAMKMIKE